ncbi:MAG: hypothetical protein R2787_13390 [Saprospiraceae bacterium]
MEIANPLDMYPMPEVQDLLETAWAEPMGPGRLRALATAGQTLRQRIREVGDTAFDQIQKTGQSDVAKIAKELHITYAWSSTAKAVMILWRDIVFRHHEAMFAHHVGEVLEQDLENLADESLETLRQASEELKSHGIPSWASTRQMEKTCSAWLLAANPWPVYQKQMDILSTQCADLVKANQLLIQLGDQLTSMGKLVNQSIDQIQEDLTFLSAQLLSLEDDLQALPDKVTRTILKKVLLRIDTIDQFSRAAVTKNPFNDLLESYQARIPEDLVVPMDLNAGQVVTRDIRLRKSFRIWFEAELMPLLFEILETRDEYHSGSSIVLTNLRNRLSAAQEGVGTHYSPAQKQEVLQSLLERRKDLQPLQSGIAALQEETMHRFRSATNVRDLLRDGRLFLTMPLESSLQRMSEQSNALSSLVAQRIRKSWKSLLSWQRKAIREESLSVGEKLLRFIKSKTPDPTAEHYTSLFLTGGFIGDALLVTRKDEQQRLQKSLKEWREGYRGTVLLTGGRHSGKSMFVESFSRQFFPSATIRLQPGQVIQLAGRTLTPGYDLEPALEFIGKYALQSKALVWIDDLENWSDAGPTFSRNVRALVRFMDLYSTRLFFLVSLNRVLLPHLDRTHGLASSCQTIIHLDQLDEISLQKAILIRHGATHKVLVNEQGLPVETDQFVREIRQIHRECRGNIGASLFMWASRIRMHGEHEVRLVEPAHYHLPLILDARNFPLFRVLLLYRQINEYRLRRLFGPSFDSEFAPLVRRWLSLRILQRSAEGWLEIHPAVAHELIHQLEWYAAEPIYSETTLTAYGIH